MSALKINKFPEFTKVIMTHSITGNLLPEPVVIAEVKGGIETTKELYRGRIIEKSLVFESILKKNYEETSKEKEKEAIDIVNNYFNIFKTSISTNEILKAELKLAILITNSDFIDTEASVLFDKLYNENCRETSTSKKSNFLDNKIKGIFK